MSKFPEDYSEASECVICEADLPKRPTRDAENDLYCVACTNCGTYRIGGSEYAWLVKGWRNDSEKEEYLALLSHQVRSRQRTDEPPFIDSNWLRSVLDGDLAFPNAIQQIENLIIYLAETLRPGEHMNVNYTNCQAIAGSSSRDAFSWVLETACDNGWIQGGRSRTMAGYQILDCKLTLGGWEWYNEIGQRKRSRIAFMAMPYGNADLNAIVNDHFRPAVAQTGFTLLRLDDQPKAGIIDNHLRVAIRRARLLISDISHDNHGAIWEAGFAEGLGLPVIYTCEKSKLQGKHFDIRNCQMVPWESDHPEEAAEMLKATIRNSLPDEAVLEDDDTRASTQHSPLQTTGCP